MINLTLDNQFRNPFRWGKCPRKIGVMKKFGVSFSTRFETNFFEKRWTLAFYFYKWFWQFSNYPFQ